MDHRKNVDQYEGKGTSWRKAVQQNWLEGEGPCRECPIRDKNQRDEPGFAAGNFSADLMLVGSEPGDKTDSKHVSNNERLKKDMPPGYGESGNPRTHGDYTDLVFYEWPFFEPVRNNLISNKRDNKIEFENIFFTNALKCSNLSPKCCVPTPKSSVRDAETYCRDYLEDEIAIVQPSVIVAFGKKAIRSVFNKLERKPIEDDVSNSSIKTIMLETESVNRFATFGNDPTVIPSYHWASVNRNYRHVVDDVAEYYQRLRQTIIDEIEMNN